MATWHTDSAWNEPRFETMETRLLLAVDAADFARIQELYPDLVLTAYEHYHIIEITAGNLNESALRDAILEAGDTARNDLIVVRTTASQHTILLSGEELLIDIHAGDYGTVTIVSLGEAMLIIDAGGQSRVLNIGEHADVGLAGLVITGGYAGGTIVYEGGGYDMYTRDGGGGILNHGVLTLVASGVMRNTARWYVDHGSWGVNFGDGGGIQNMGSLMLFNSAIIENFGAGAGLGIYTAGSLSVTSSVISDNTRAEDTWEGRYGIFIGDDVAVTVTNSFIARNSSGGICLGGFDSTLTVTGSTITENNLQEIYDDGGDREEWWYGFGIMSWGGDVWVAESTISGHRSTGSESSGGGIVSYGGSVTVTNSVIRDNAAAGKNGGGLYIDGGEGGDGVSLTVTDSYVIGNTAAGSGGGICVGYGVTATVTNSTVTGNTAAYGGGIANGYISCGGAGGVLTIVNSVIAGNHAMIVDSHSGANGGYGGGIYSLRSDTSVVNSTIAGNTAERSGGGIAGGGEYEGLVDDYVSLITVTNSIVANNTVGGLANDIDPNTPQYEDEDGEPRIPVTIHGYNNLTTFEEWNGVSQGHLVHNAAKPLFVDAAAGDYRLATGSQAIDAGDNARAGSAGLTSGSKDLAGHSRIYNGTIDIGAYEHQGETPTPTVTTTKAVATSVKAKASGISEIVLTWQAPAVKSLPGLVVDRYEIYDDKGAWMDSVDAAAPLTFTAKGLSPKTSYTFRVVVVCTAAGNEVTSAKAATVKATTLAFVAPKAGKAIKGDVGLTSATIRWQAQSFADDGYEVIWFAAKDKSKIPLGSQTVAAGETSFVIPGLLPGVKYTYVVTAVNSTVSVASSALKKSVTMLKFTATAKPAVTKSSLTADSATLTWKPTALPKTVTTGSMTYEVYYCTGTKAPKPGAADWTKLTDKANVDGLWAEIAPVVDAKGKVTMTAAISGLEPGTTYYVHVRSVWSEAGVALSNSASVKFTTKASAGPVVKATAVDWLAAQLAQQDYARYVYKDYADGLNHFTQKIWMGDHASNVPEMDEAAPGFSGPTGIAVTLDLTQHTWGGYMLVNGVLGAGQTVPNNNADATIRAGIDLGGACKLTFYAKGTTGNEQVEFFMGGLGWQGGTPFAACPDSTDKITLGVVRLTTTWTQYEIELPPGTDLSSVGCGFGWVANNTNNPGADGIAFALDEIKYEFAEKLTSPAFLQSYESAGPTDIGGVLDNFAYTYDNALAAMALSSAGNHEAARRIADALVYAVQNDRTYDDGRLRNVYSNGSPESFPGWLSGKGEAFARLPGFYDQQTKVWLEDVYAASSSTGNMAWAILALCDVYKNDQAAPNRDDYLAAAVRIAEFIRTDLWCDEGPGGFTGGFQGWDDGTDYRKVTYKSTEHNIDLITAFARLAEFTDEATYSEASDHAKSFVLSMYSDEGCFWMGTGEDGVTINKEVLPLDCNTWAILALGDSFDRAEGLKVMAYLEEHMAKVGNGYGFHATDEPGVWFEGTAQVALAWLALGETAKYEQVLTYLNRCANIDGSITAADRDGVTTGLSVEGTDIEWLYGKRIHVGATAWLAFAQMGVNPLATP